MTNKIPHSPPTLVHLSGNEILSGLETVVGTVYLWCHILVSELVVVSLNRILIDEQSAGTRPCGDTSQDVPLDRYRIQGTTLAHVVTKHPTYTSVYI